MKLTKGRIMKLMKKNKQTKKRYRKHPSKRRTITKTFRRRKHVNLANMTLKNFGLSGGKDDGVDVSISNTPSVNVGDSLEQTPEGVKEVQTQVPTPEGVSEQVISTPEGVKEQVISTPEGVSEVPSKPSGFTSLLKSGVEKVSNTMTNLKDRINASMSRSSSPTPQPEPQNEMVPIPTPTPTPTIPNDASRENVSRAMNTLIEPFANSIADIIVQKLASHNIGANTVVADLDNQMIKNAEIEANS